MKPEVAARLLEINRHFYTKFAAQFSATRQRLQPGVMKLLEQIPIEASLLDLGCGNGELARELAKRGHKGKYTGLDQSSALLEVARRDLSSEIDAEFYQVNLAKSGWDQALPHERYDLALCLAVLHHLPGTQSRQRLLRDIHSHLAPGGQLMLSVWQFLQNKRLRERVQPWEKAGVDPADVDSGDYLLDWRRGGYGLRYVHYFEPDELQKLADQTGYVIQTIFKSDGQDSQLSQYQIWNKPK